MGRIRDLLRAEPGDWFFGRVLPDDAQSADDKAVKPDSAYLSLYLEAMRVSAVRDRGQAFYGVAIGSCCLESRAGQRAELLAVSTPDTLRGVDPRHLDRVVTGTVPLIDAVPYRGGGLDMEVGLFAIPSGYLLGPYLDLLGDVATVACAFLPLPGALASAALIPPVRRGLDLLLGAETEARLEVGIDHSWQQPVTGHYAVVRAAAPTEGFRLSAGNRLLNPDGTEVRAPYLVLRLDAQPERHNWSSIPDVAAAYEVVRDAVRRDSIPDVRVALATFRRVAVFSPDLLEDDGIRLHAKVEEQVRKAMPATGTGGPQPAPPAQPAPPEDRSVPWGLPDLVRIPFYDDA